MTKQFRPMLASPCEDIAALRYPVLVSPKLDGIRCLIRGGVAVSRNLKPIPNAFVQACLRGLPDGLDGELIVGEPTGTDVWNRTSSGVMREDGEPEFTFYVFDDFTRDTDRFDARADYRRLVHIIPSQHVYAVNGVAVLEHGIARDAERLSAMEEAFVAQGYEGLMIRDPAGPYKFGRSTAREGWLLKLKRFEDHEAIVTGFVERFHNANEATTDALGLTKRSTAKAGKVGTDTLGALVCTFNGVTFEVGSGFTDAQRAEIWTNGAKYLGRHVTFKCQGFTPAGVPRFPVFKGWRHDADRPSALSRFW